MSHLLHCRFMPPIEAADVLCSLDNEDSCMDTYQQVSPLSASLTVRACDPSLVSGQGSCHLRLSVNLLSSAASTAAHSVL